MFDIVIPVGPNDTDNIHNQIFYTKKNIIGYNNIYLVTSVKDLSVEDCHIIHDSIFPFSLNTISDYFGKINRNGWYLQQLIKLYAGLVIPNITENYLVIDADTFFLKPTNFIDNNGLLLYNPGTEYHSIYFDHMVRLHPSLVRVYSNMSGISHHMIFNNKCITSLISMVEKLHNSLFYKVFLEKVDLNHKHGSGASEYEIYFNYMLANHSDLIKIRKLRWANVSKIDFTNIHNHDYVSNHNYMRNK